MPLASRGATPDSRPTPAISADTKLTPRPASIPAWDSHTPDEKRLFARMQEVFAGFLEHVDVQVGRIVDHLELLGLRDDTLIVYVVGDNGKLPQFPKAWTQASNTSPAQSSALGDLQLTTINHGGSK